MPSVLLYFATVMLLAQVFGIILFSRHFGLEGKPRFQERRKTREGQQEPF